MHDRDDLCIFESLVFAVLVDEGDVEGENPLGIGLYMTVKRF